MGSKKPMYPGIPPEGKDWFLTDFKVDDIENDTNWNIYVKKYRRSDEWINFKLVINGYSIGSSANLQAAYSRLSDRLSRTTDVYKYMKNRTWLIDSVIEYMSGKDWKEFLRCNF